MNLPYISDTGTTPPESCIFAQFLNIGALFIGVVAYIRFKQVIILLGSYKYKINGLLYNHSFFKDCTGRGGGGSNLGSFGFGLFSRTRSTLDHLTMVPPFDFERISAARLLRKTYE